MKVSLISFIAWPLFLLKKTTATNYLVVLIKKKDGKILAG